MTAPMYARRPSLLGRRACPRVVPGATSPKERTPHRVLGLLDLASAPSRPVRRRGQVELSPYAAYLTALSHLT